jgi:hypothetical protein
VDVSYRAGLPGAGRRAGSFGGVRAEHRPLGDRAGWAYGRRRWQVRTAEPVQSTPLLATVDRRPVLFVAAGV